MSSLVPEQLVVVQKAVLEATFGFQTKGFEGIQKVAELNLQAVTATVADNHEVIAKAFSAKDAQDLYALQTRHVQVAADKARIGSTSTKLYLLSGPNSLRMPKRSSKRIRTIHRRSSTTSRRTCPRDTRPPRHG